MLYGRLYPWLNRLPERTSASGIGRRTLAEAMQSTMPPARIRSEAAHQDRALLRSMIANAGIRLGAPGYHPAQCQGHIKAVAMARAVQNAIHNQRFRLGVIGHHPSSSTPKPTPVYNRITTGHSSKHSARLHFEDRKCRLQFMYGCPIFGSLPILSCRAFSERCAPATCSVDCRDPESGLDSPCVGMTRTSSRILVLPSAGRTVKCDCFRGAPFIAYSSPAGFVTRGAPFLSKGTFIGCPW